MTDTLMPPIMLHTMMYHSMLFLPYLHREGSASLTSTAAAGGGSATEETAGTAKRGGEWRRCLPGREVKDDDKCGDDEDATVDEEAGT